MSPENMTPLLLPNSNRVYLTAGGLVPLKCATASARPEHVPACNPGCSGDDHLLLADLAHAELDPMGVE